MKAFIDKVLVLIKKNIWTKIFAVILALIFFPLTITIGVSYLLVDKTKVKSWLKYTIAGLLIFFGATLTFAMYAPSKSTPSSVTKPIETSSDSSKATENKNELFLVKRVVDGDTVELENGQKIRYIGIDTPETVSPDKPIQCFGKEASDKNKALVEGKKVRLEKDVSETDKYSRLLRYIYLEDGTFVNLQLVKQGFARSSTYPPDVKHQEEFRKAEEEARTSSIGLWAPDTCSGTTEAVTKPAVVAPVTVPVATGNTPQTNCTIKGNISSSGEKIYHIPGGAYYEKTTINTSDGEMWFCSEAEAVSAGWRASLR